ncbi:MAG: bifunctional glutamate N-acetyltransferase/amino-acid acetyltransferase ArgJ [Nitrospira sp.]|jgi:glutamate N-acetyltransferase/amino-acid N-acetyltransferase|nr:MAG: bifunctional glutamate N-acetyltransferase/amino-acid acetyltransferase ArgJ [Nitrospira sp.]
MKTISGGVTAPLGFLAAGVYAGIKKKNQLDLALLLSERAGPVAGVFTTNQIVAAPVILDRLHLKKGVGRAILVNSGNANACTGPEGMGAAKDMAQLVATALQCPPHSVFIGSTGVIGQPLPIARIKDAVPDLLARVTRRGGSKAARAIMTTDLKPKETAVRARLGGRMVTVGGMAKGSGMIHPNMATMLAYLTTDAAINRRALQAALRRAVDQSFNCITVDGDTSTNDTVLCLANGMADNRKILLDSVDFEKFCAMLETVCRTLALKICWDGEGVTKVVRVEVRGAKTAKAARQVAQTIATSNLVKTALFGGDANWGRVMAALGRAGVAIDPTSVSLQFGDVPMVRKGQGLGQAAERRLTKVFQAREFTILVDLGQGKACAHMWTTDLSYEYVRINASYRS